MGKQTVVESASASIWVGRVLVAHPCASRCCHLTWLLSALRGEVYTTRCLSRRAMAMAYSATTVLPAEVCAATSTDSRRSKLLHAADWNGSSLNGYSFAATGRLLGGHWVRNLGMLAGSTCDVGLMHNAQVPLR